MLRIIIKCANEHSTEKFVSMQNLKKNCTIIARSLQKYSNVAQRSIKQEMYITTRCLAQLIRLRYVCIKQHYLLFNSDFLVLKKMGLIQRLVYTF